jgi:type IV pilus biogenesis/stability protein PilW
MRGRLAAICLALLSAPGCGPTQKNIEAAQIHYDLAINAMENANDAQTALKELQVALQLNPNLADAQNAMGLVLHLMLHRPEQAVPHYLEAMRLDPKNSEIKNNLGACYIELGKYPEAIALFEQALQDVLYRTPFIAQGNLGWALYKNGDVQGAVDHLKIAVQMNPEYCQGYRSLGMIYSDTGKLADARRSFEAFQKHCPQLPEGHYRLGLVLLKLDDQNRARAEFAACAKDQKDQPTTTELGAECERLLKLMP